ncbi:hypothetical protein IE4803_CH03133 [Rhizobium etli bv. phaseoli str. IE4803]|nr:hypothetical protein IE4803_CH03133 [Rhizobium etli bv. phaseoli str. IE4803]
MLINCLYRGRSSLSSGGACKARNRQAYIDIKISLCDLNCLVLRRQGASRV